VPRPDFRYSYAGSLTTWVIVALLAGLGAGLLVLAYPTPPLLMLVGIIEPIGIIWVNAIRMTVIPLVVALLITGVASATDLRTVGGIGARAFASFLALLTASAIFGLLVVPPLFGWLRVDRATTRSLGGAVQESQASAVPGFAEWLVGIVPTNPVKAAADGMMLPLVVFVLAFGLALLTVPAQRRAVVVGFFGGVGDAMLVIVRVVIAFAPIGVFALMVPVASRTGLAAAGALGYYVAAVSAVQILAIALLYPLARVAAGVSIPKFARAVFPAQAVAVSSSSSLASLPALVDGADRRLGLPQDVTGVVLPLAVSTFKMGTPLIWLVAVVFLARLYGVPLGTLQLVGVAVTAILTSFSTPGVPHGWLLVITPLVAAIGIPVEGIGLLIAVDAIPDIFATALNVTADMVAASIVSCNLRPEPVSTA
jgi:proton glutamate symport protein